jgi:5'-3' exonuclease
VIVLVGNDVIPNLPHICGNKSVLQDIILLYMEVLPTLDGYVHQRERAIELVSVSKIYERLASLDSKFFQNIRAEVEPGTRKHNRKRRGQPANEEDEQHHQKFIRAHKQQHYEKK